MSRRAFLLSLAGAAAASAVSPPRAARAQAADRVRRIGMLMGVARDAEGVGNSKAFRLRLRELGWIEGRNLRIEERWGLGDAKLIEGAAKELAGLAPDAI